MRPRLSHASFSGLTAGFALLAFVAGDASRVSAEPSTTALTSSTLESATQSITHFKLDASGKPAFLARFSDGPRHVPTPRGNAKARAERLGLGGHEVTRAFLWTRPTPELLAEVKGETPRNLLWPVVDGHFGRGFGFTRTLRPELAHNGIDIGAKAGAIVRAAADGLVVYSDNGLKGYGNCIMILHANGWLTLYAHTQRATVQTGWRVKRGERIGLVGQTGYAWGPHLHFELRDNGRLRDPEPLITGWKSDEVNGPLVALDGELQPPAASASAAPIASVAPAIEHKPRLEAKPEPKQEAKPAPKLTPLEHLLLETPTADDLAKVDGRPFHKMLWPVKDGVLSAKGESFELKAPSGSPVRAAADGLVVYSGNALPGYYGNVVVVLHGNGWVTVYSNLGERTVKEGDHVRCGRWIARSGGLGDAVRFEWRVDGKTRDRDAALGALAGAP